MKEFTEFINESLTRTQRMIVGSVIIDMLRGSGVEPDKLNKMFNNLDIEIIENVEKFLYSTDKENFMAYAAAKDEYLRKDNKTSIVSRLVKYISTFVTNQN